MKKYIRSRFEEKLYSPIRSAEDYFAYVKALYDEWSADAGRERTLYEMTRERVGRCIPGLVDRQPPQFFTGDIHAEMAMISLNPHANENAEIDTIPFCGSWEDYRSFWVDFPRHRYGENGCAAHTKIARLSYFDRRAQHFLSGCAGEVTAADLAKWNMFHIELFPIGSSDFKSVKVGAIDEYACQYILRMLEALVLTERKLIVALNAQLLKFLKRAKKLNMLTGLTVRDKSFSIGEKTVLREDYVVKLATGKTLKIAAAKTFAKRGYLSNAELAVYAKKIFSPEEIKTIRSAVGIKRR